MKRALVYGLVVGSSVFANVNDVMMDASVRYWFAETQGNVGDPGKAGAFKNDDEGVYSLTFRADFGRTIAELAYTNYNISSPLTSDAIVKNSVAPGFTTILGSRSRLDMKSFDLNLRNLLFENENLSLRWIYGVSFVDIQNTVKNIVNVSQTLDSTGILPILGLEGEWFLRSDLSFRTHYKFSDYNLGDDEIKVKDMEFSFVYSPMDSFDFELGYRRYRLDVDQEYAPGLQTTLYQDIKGPYTQVNWLF